MPKRCTRSLACWWTSTRACVSQREKLNKKAFDASKYIDSPDVIAAYRSEAFETGDDVFIAQTIGTIARARGMSSVAKVAGVSRANLYRALNTSGKPEFATVMKVLDALGMQLVAKPKEGRRS
jgi:probable addiction module antidote protein